MSRTFDIRIVLAALVCSGSGIAGELGLKIHREGTLAPRAKADSGNDVRSTRQAALRKLAPGTTVFINKDGIQLARPGTDLGNFWKDNTDLIPYRTVAEKTKGLLTIGNAGDVHPLFSMILDHAKPTTQSQNELDVVVVVDTTGSMGGVLSAVAKSLEKLGEQTDVFTAEGRRIRLALVAYQDEGDEYVAKVVHQFSYSTQAFVEKVRELRPGGGGDTPEAVYEGAAVAFNDLRWRPTAETRMIWITDAPPKTLPGGATLESIIHRAVGKDRPTVIYPMVVGGGFRW